MRSFTATVFGLAAPVVLALPAIAIVQSAAPIADFLATIGGSTSKETVGGHLQSGWRKMLPLTRDGGEVIGARFFSEKIAREGSATAMRARTAFADECRAKGGALANERSEVHTLFRDRVLTDVAWRGDGGKYFQTGLTAVCETAHGAVLGGFVAIVYDTTAVNRGFATALVGKVPTETAIYAYRPGRIVSQAMIEGRQDGERARLAAHAADRKVLEDRFEEFRKAIVIGTDTNCGTVIELRGPMVEVALPVTRTAPNGQSTFWSKREALFPPGTALCRYGL